MLTGGGLDMATLYSARLLASTRGAYGEREWSTANFLMVMVLTAILVADANVVVNLKSP